MLKAEVKSITLSDHAPVMVSLELKDIPKRQRSWRLDESLLYDHGILKELKKDLNLFFKDNDVEDIAPTVLYDSLRT